LKENPTSVRIATHHDERKLLNLLIELHRDNNDGWGIPYDVGVIMRRIEQGTRQDPAQRSDPGDQWRAVHGVIDSPDGQRIDASIGCFILPITWYSNWVSITELWVYVREEERGQGLEEELAQFGLWVRERLRDPDQAFFPMVTGFLEGGKRDMRLMERLWPKIWGPKAKKIGVLYWVDE
jgi:GNAT superfamily N-acetyltransferase